MNWDAIGAIGETVGAVAVFASLIYLAIQIRAQNKESRLGAIFEFTDLYNQINDTITSNSEMADIWKKALSERGLGNLDDAERIRFSSLLQKITRTWENSYYQYNEGRLNERLWQSFHIQISEVAACPAYRSWWQQRSHWYSEEFQRFVENNNVESKYELLSVNRSVDT
jgi:hypothetical protein